MPAPQPDPFDPGRPGPNSPWVQLIQDLAAAALSSRTIVDLLPCVNTGVVIPAMPDPLITERDRLAARIRELTRADRAA